MKWQKTPVDAAAVKHLSQRYGLDLLSAAVLVRRNITTPDDLPYWLEEDLRYLHDPFHFPDMPEAVERIFQARDEGERVLVFGDRDVDGITSTAVMVETLRSLGIDTRWQVPEGDDIYGLTSEVVKSFSEEHGTLIITVDCGITSVDEIALAGTFGIDTIIVDHHNAAARVPSAVAVINPKVGEGYPFQGLCACAVVAKLRQALALGQTELYGQPVTLLHARPLDGDGGIEVEAVALEHGFEADRAREVFPPGGTRLQMGALERFLVGRSLICFDAPRQEQLLKHALGGGVDIYLLDLAVQTRELFPALTGKTLLEMGEGSRLARYTRETAREMDVLLALYRAVAAARFPAIRESLESVLDLVAVATLADMMPIVNENRPLVRAGLERLNKHPHAGIAALLRELSLAHRKIVSRDISWAIAPVINASGRMGTPSMAVKMFLTADETERVRLAGEIHKLNQKRRKVGQEAWKTVLPRAKELLQGEEPKIIVLHEPTVHRGVTGIIAGRLSRRYNLPAAVLTSVGGHVVGSVRSARGFVATAFLDQFSDILEKWGGHNQAAGFHFFQDRLPRFWDRLSQVMASVDLDDHQEEEVLIDAELPPRYLNPGLEELVGRFEPYGQGNPELRFLARKMVLEDVQIIGKDQDHLRLLLAGGGFKWPSVYWSAAERVPKEFSRGDRVDVVFEFSRNYYNGNETIQLVIIDMIRSAEQLLDGLDEG
ncbi:single-stranded-DNA-specific exonuclease [Alkalispirochaeta americana]|uniref:Single-stranded-DNA-specific exonuclease RecJ n=1 Tax=Alkalispirochaeta americana TaxID=159291 RepID=A0A1N6V1Y6_9SPIO|nr:single-stranded-DNA-specific exonuclease RecJ [Alkalispirochaeta americana]SIQ71769.1 single-stranded-DNA-specific exonuclease [Alkalispirochaeta americana]